MIQMNSVSLPKDTIAHLKEKQDLVDGEADYATKVAKGKSLWDRKSKSHFTIIRRTLEEMCVGKRRCNYCEDSAADEVEHIEPKDMYPEKVFVWSNYLFACSLCNGPKNNQFAVFDNAGNVVNVARKRDEPVIPPFVGEHLFINPRSENPLEFLMLDLKTFLFVAIPTISVKNKKRAEYTYTTLGLNSRDYLVEARKEAFGTYLDSLQLYVRRKDEGAPEPELVHRKQELHARHHPTVWQEMKRWHKFYPQLDTLFTKAPELL